MRGIAVFSPLRSENFLKYYLTIQDMDTFESKYRPEEARERNPFHGNLDNYFNHYDSELRQKYGREYDEKLHTVQY